jgi:hypothetical protein
MQILIILISRFFFVGPVAGFPAADYAGFPATFSRLQI